MRIFGTQLQRRAQLLRIERAMARLIKPAGVFIDERLVADLAPIANAGGITGQIALISRTAVVGGPVSREADRYIRIALARGKTVAHAGNREYRGL